MKERYSIKKYSKKNWIYITFEEQEPKYTRRNQDRPKEVSGESLMATPNPFLPPYKYPPSYNLFPELKQFTLSKQVHSFPFLPLVPNLFSFKKNEGKTKALLPLPTVFSPQNSPTLSPFFSWPFIRSKEGYLIVASGIPSWSNGEPPLMWLFIRLM